MSKKAEGINVTFEEYRDTLPLSLRNFVVNLSGALIAQGIPSREAKRITVLETQKLIHELVKKKGFERTWAFFQDEKRR